METHIISRLPKHLKQFVVDQQYEHYTPVDHAVWRYVMRLNYNFLNKRAHKSYTKGLKTTGISIERIPSISEMNKALSRIGWGAVCVDGFIPPQAFMEFQAHHVLPIAAGIRQAGHIEYTPAPDIIHEAAGHAPIIADPEYAEYLRLFGEIGSKAFSSKKDFELFEAIRHLSIVKENPNSSKHEFRHAEQMLELLQQDMGKPSEMALIRNLHWWTVEYGLIGNMDKPAIYGAGLLSSIKESISCLQPRVKKLPYSIKAAAYHFDITTMQPQLFVTPSFVHLSEVLDEFAQGMALRTGGSAGMEKAVQSARTATVQLSSGIEISGKFTDFIQDKQGKVIFIKTSGPSQLCELNRELPGQGKSYHVHGYSSPVGKLRRVEQALEQMSFGNLKKNGIIPGEEINLEFESGIKVKGRLKSILKNKQGINLLMSIARCKVSLRDQLLFDPSWGTFDMAVGREVVSVYPGPADPEAFGPEYSIPSEHTPRPKYDKTEKHLQDLYGKLRKIREGQGGIHHLDALFRANREIFQNNWLLTLEAFELIHKEKRSKALKRSLEDILDEQKTDNDALRRLIADGLELIAT